MNSVHGRELAAALHTSDVHTCSCICRSAATHHRLQEESCNGHPCQGDPYMDIARVNKLQDRWDKRIEREEARIEANIRRLAAKLPMVKEADFQGDPRGATVKLVCHDPSLHDSFGGDGVCVLHS